MPTAPKLLRFVEDELARSESLIGRSLAGTLAALRDPRDGLAKSERSSHFELVEALQRQGARYRVRFLEALRDGVRRELAAQDGGDGPGAAGPLGALELMDESRVAADIEISRAVQLIDSKAESERRELQTFTSTRCGLPHVSEESNPLRTVVCATALWEAAAAVTASPAQRATLEHSMWQLMSRITSAALSYPTSGDKRLTAEPVFCDAIADGISSSRVEDATPFRRGLARVAAFLAEQVQWQLRDARASVDSLQRAERRELLEQMATVRTSPPLRLFVTGIWAKVLAAATLRFGDRAGPTAGCLKTVDDLLWSLQTPDHPQNRQRLVGLLPGLLQRLRGGIELIALPAAASAPAPEQIVQRMREELMPDAPAPRLCSDSVIDLASMEAVPADFPATDMSAPEQAGARIDARQPGDRLRVFLRGRWTRVQLLWRSEQGPHVLFAGKPPGGTRSITRRALERLDAAGLAKTLEDGPVVQRAIDALVHQLLLPA